MNSRPALLLHKSPFFWHLFSQYLLLLVFAALASSLALLDAFSDHEREEADLSLLWQVGLLVEVLQAYPGAQGMENMESLLFNLAADTGNRFSFIDAQGRTQMDTAEDPVRMGQQLQRQEIMQAQLRGEGRVTRVSPVSGQRYHYYARRLLSEEGDLLGFVRGAYSLSELQTEQRHTLLRSLIYVSLILLLALMGAYYLANRLAERVDRMTRIAGTIAQGDFARRIPVERSSGLGKLAQAINELARSSASRVTEVTTDRNRLAAIFAGMVEGVIDVDQHQQILHINDAAAKLLGLNPHRCLNKPLWQEVRLRELTDALDMAMRNQDVVRSQMRLRQDRGELVVDVYAASLSTDDGEPIGAVLVLNDITELENLSRVRTDFVANASHELKTPITAIRGLAETVLSDEEMPVADMRGFVDRMHRQSLRLSQLISDLMAISRLEAGQNPQDFMPVNMSLLVRQAVLAAEPAAEARHQQFQATLCEEALQVHGDRQNLSQLVDNLIDNAIKYTPDGGRVDVSLERRDDSLLLQVRDTGIGISPQYHKRIFERFYRVDKVRSQSLGGTGLGLSIVKNIVEKHRGSISLSSHPGVGSTFSVTLPLAV